MESINAIATTTTASYLSNAERRRIIDQLPDTWGEQEINAFLEQYGQRIAEAAPVEPESPDDTVAAANVEPPDVPATTLPVSALPISSGSRKGLTLDTYIILNGRTVTLRSLWEGGLLVPEKYVVMQGTRKRPYHAIEYRARVVGYPRFLTITEETWKVLNIHLPNVTPADEEHSLQQYENIQATPRMLQPDELDGRKTH